MGSFWSRELRQATVIPTFQVYKGGYYKTKFQFYEQYQRDVLERINQPVDRERYVFLNFFLPSFASGPTLLGPPTSQSLSIRIYLAPSPAYLFPRSYFPRQLCWLTPPDLATYHPTVPLLPPVNCPRLLTTRHYYRWVAGAALVNAFYSPNTNEISEQISKYQRNKNFSLPGWNSATRLLQ